jgi:acetyl-CoA synthase
MSQFVIDSALKGATAIVEQANELVTDSIEELGADATVAFPNTAYYLPVIYGFTGRKVEKPGDLVSVVSYTHNLLSTLTNGTIRRNIGIATLIAEESIQGVRFARGEQPEVYHGYRFNGPIDDVQLRTWGVWLADGTISGMATIMGAAKSDKVAAKIVRELQSKGLLTLVCGNVKGCSIVEQLSQEGVELSYQSLVVPLGSDTISAVYALGYASRLAFSFGGIRSGDVEQLLLWTKQRAPVFILALGELDDLKYATGLGALIYGFALIADSTIPGIMSLSKAEQEQIIAMPFDDIPGVDDAEKGAQLVQRSIEARGIKTKVSKLSLPVAYGPAFEGR